MSLMHHPLLLHSGCSSALPTLLPSRLPSHFCIVATLAGLFLSLPPPLSLFTECSLCTPYLPLAGSLAISGSRGGIWSTESPRQWPQGAGGRGALRVVCVRGGTAPPYTELLLIGRQLVSLCLRLGPCLRLARALRPFRAHPHPGLGSAGLALSRTFPSHIGTTFGWRRAPPEHWERGKREQSQNEIEEGKPHSQKEARSPHSQRGNVREGMGVRKEVDALR